MILAIVLAALLTGDAEKSALHEPHRSGASQIEMPGSATTLAPTTEGSALAAAGVYRLDLIADQGAKIFGLMGTDPVFNGLTTYIAFYGSPSEAWVVYPIGDIIDYKVVMIARGRAELEIQENPDATQPMVERTRRIAVTWSPSEGGLPTSVAVAPAR